jgi:hypothetical protein
LREEENMMQQTPRLALPLIAAGQSQKDVTHNDAVLALDRLVALAVLSASALAPPASPPDGGVWIVPAAGATIWGQPAGTLMHRQDEAWIAALPHDGQVAYVAENGLLLVHAGGWQIVRRMGTPMTVELPSGGGTIDAEARSALASLISIMEHHGFVTQSP